MRFIITELGLLWNTEGRGGKMLVFRSYEETVELFMTGWTFNIQKSGD